MHLADRAGRERLGLDALEHVLPGHAELLLHHRDDLRLGERRHVVLERGELLDELGREQVGPGREDLAELANVGPSSSSASRRRRARSRGRSCPSRPSARSWSPCLAMTRPISVARPRSWPSTRTVAVGRSRSLGPSGTACPRPLAPPRSATPRRCSRSRPCSARCARRGSGRCRAGTPCGRSCRRCRRRGRRPRPASAASTIACGGVLGDDDLARPRSPASSRANCFSPRRRTTARVASAAPASVAAGFSGR